MNLELPSIKTKLIAACEAEIKNRIERAKKAMDAAQESANSETKSTAGDKYETAKAMAQIERDMAAKNLAEAVELLNKFRSMPHGLSNNEVNVGSLVFTNTEIFFVSVALGKITVDDIDFYCISAVSPLAKAIWGLKSGEEFLINGVKKKILSIH